jgi:uncharacterized membrane protein
MTARTILLVTGTGMELFVAALMLAMPRLSPRGLLFGVPVPKGFPSTDTARQALRSYRAWVGVPALLGVIANLIYPSPGLQTAFLLSITAFGIAGFRRQYTRLRPFAIQPPMTRQAELGPPEGLPWFTWLGIVPLLFLGGVALYLHAHWDQIPSRYPIHFDITGAPNRWANKSAAGIYGMLIFGGQFGVFFFAMIVAAWYGTRRSDSMRKPMMLVLLAGETVISLIVGLIPLQTASGFHLPVLAMLSPSLLLFAALGYAAHESNKPRDPIDPTPNECWKSGMIYYNPNDAALFVQRRDSLGFTFNFANRWSWVLNGFLLLQILSLPVLIKILSASR